MKKIISFSSVLAGVLAIIVSFCSFSESNVSASMPIFVLTDSGQSVYWDGRAYWSNTDYVTIEVYKSSGGFVAKITGGNWAKKDDIGRTYTVKKNNNRYYITYRDRDCYWDM